MIAINKRDKNVKIEYRVVPGAHVTKAQMQPVFDLLTKKCRGKRPTPVELVQMAKPKSSPIHDLFEWDDAIAAQRHRLARAQYLLRSINIVRVNVRTLKVVSGPVRWTTPTEFDVRHSHRIISYTSTQNMKNEDLEDVFQRARLEFNAWLSRYENYLGFHEWFDSVLTDLHRSKTRMETCKPRTK